MAQKEIIPVINSVPTTINGKIYDVLSEAVLKKATAYIRKYETETAAIIFNEGLTAIKDMCIEAERLNLRKTSDEFQLITDLLKRRILEVTTIVAKVHGSRQQPVLSDKNREAALDIERALISIFGKSTGISLSKVTPLLLEAFNSGKENI
ncbi:MAG: hypothetical protein FWD05_02495 [Oscillospiraceae bacterium]|nr:hypothetical protein [Oscillospiraceae bacterium]